jgi:RimJ/RimL family protein N-acetyltransferase
MKRHHAFLSGEKIILSPLSPEDVTEEYLDWVNDASLARYIPFMAFPADAERTKEYVRSAQANPNTFMLAVVEKSTGQHVGNIKLGPVDWINRRAEFGLLIGAPEARGKGYGEEAVKLVIDYAFRVLNLQKVGAGYMSSNTAARKTYEKCGMRQEGVLARHFFNGEGYDDLVYMAIFKES